MNDHIITNESLALSMVLVLIAICGAMLLLRWAAMIWG